MKTIFVLICWFGFGNSVVFSTDHFDTNAECEAARKVILTYTQKGWKYPENDEIVCIETIVKE